MSRLDLFFEKFREYLKVNPKVSYFQDGSKERYLAGVPIVGFCIVKYNNINLKVYPTTLNTLLFTFCSETTKFNSIAVCLELDSGNFNLPGWACLDLSQFFEDIRYFGQSNAENFILNS